MYVAANTALQAWAELTPEAWECHWLKWSVSLATARATAEEIERLPYISNEDIASWTGRLVNPDAKPADAESRRFTSGDVLFNKLRPYLAKVYHATSDGLSSGELLCLRPSAKVHPRYLFYVLTSKAFIDAVDAETFGSKMPRADWDIVGHQPLPLPSLSTQRRIASFLDQKTAQIDKLVEKKQELSGRLAERRRAIISQAVTKGLDPSAPMKDSGIEWLGEVPAHWDVKRLKYVSPRITVGIVITPAAYYVEEGTLALRGLNIRPMDFDLTEVRYLSDDGHRINRKSTLRAGDLVAVRTGAPGTTSVITPNLEGANCIDLVIIRKPVDADSQCLGWFLNSNAAMVQYKLGSEGALQSHFNIETAGHTIICLPPIREQRDIAAFLNEQAAIQHHQLERIETSIAKLREYRSAVITAAVTGRIEALR